MKNKLLVFVLLVFIAGKVNAQCCSAGNPFFYGELSSLSKNNLQFIAGYKYSTSHQYFQGNKPIEIDFVDEAYFNYLTFQAIYGLSKRVTIQADLGYFINKTETYLKNDWAKSNGHGLGDAHLSIKYLAINKWKKKLQVIPSFGIILPIGVFDQEADHVKLPITVQPSSGSFKYQLGLLMTKTSSNSKFRTTFFGLFEYAQLINSANFYYKYGNQYLVSIMGSYQISKNFSAAFEARSENRGRSMRENDQKVESSGYNTIYLVPHASWAFYDNWSLAVNTDIPVYKYYNGIQLSNALSVSIRVSYKLTNCLVF